MAAGATWAVPSSFGAPPGSLASAAAEAAAAAAATAAAAAAAAAPPPPASPGSPRPPSSPLGRGGSAAEIVRFYTMKGEPRFELARGCRVEQVGAQAEAGGPATSFVNVEGVPHIFTFAADALLRLAHKAFDEGLLVFASGDVLRSGEQHLTLQVTKMILRRTP